MTPKRFGLALLIVGVVALAAACGQDDPTPTPTPTATPTATPAQEPAATPTPAPLGTVTVMLNPSKDTTLYGEDGGLANGAGEFIFAGATRTGAIRRGLIAFDVSGSIPAGATVQEVSLTMNLSQTTAGPEPVALHPVLADWGEGASDAFANEGKGTAAEPGDATWTRTGIGEATWQAPGGDFAATASATVIVAEKNRLYTWGPSTVMTTDVQGWLDEPDANFGWLLLGNEDGMRTAKRFDSRQNIEGFPEPQPPVLTVTYLPAS